jgi:AraC-like DNA-binding protein
LTRWRMSLASRLLRQSKFPMLEVANRSGYDSEVAFHRAFKRVTGTTPGAYRRRQQVRASG